MGLINDVVLYCFKKNLFIYLFVQINQESIAKNKNTKPHSWNPRGAGREQNLNLFGRHS